MRKIFSIVALIVLSIFVKNVTEDYTASVAHADAPPDPGCGAGDSGCL